MKRIFFISFLCSILVYNLSGCNENMPHEGTADVIVTSALEDYKLEITEELLAAGELYQEIYENALEKDSLESLGTKEDIVCCLGENGYAVVDSDNEINMRNPEQVDYFCQKVEEKKDAELILLVVLNDGGCIRYDIQNSGEEINIICSSLEWSENTPIVNYINQYPAYTWKYTGNYLFFEEYHPPGFDGPSGHTAIRVRPLDDKCRMFNRMYVEPIGYSLNTMFISDWDESDYDNLNFYDIYDALYPIFYGKQLSYEFGNTKISYEIPGKKFEEVFMAYFKIDSKVLREHTNYNPENSTYLYRPRGLYDFSPAPDIPYPEVVAYQKNEDGTVKLTVNAVWPEENLECAFSHELTIRLLENEHFQYVSNYVIPSNDNVDPTWYTARLTDEEWEEHYGGLE